MIPEALAPSAAIRPLQAMLASVPHFTPMTIRANTVVPEHLLVVGADGESCATAQAYRRLGAEVTMVASGTLLPEEDRDLVAVLRDALTEDGIAIFERARVSNLEHRQGRIDAYLRRGDVLRAIRASHLLVAPAIATRRRAGGVHWGGTPVRVIRTDPILAHAGLTESRTRRFSDSIRVISGRGDGRAFDGRHHIKATCTTHGALLGVTIVGPHAVEHLQPWILALDAGLDIDALGILPGVAGWFCGVADAPARMSLAAH